MSIHLKRYPFLYLKIEELKLYVELYLWASNKKGDKSKLNYLTHFKFFTRKLSSFELKFTLTQSKIPFMLSMSIMMSISSRSLLDSTKILYVYFLFITY